MPALGCSDHLVARDLQQARIHRVRNRFLLHRGVHDHSLELGRPNGFGGHRCVDGGFEQFLNAGLADGRAKASDLRGIAGQARLVEGHAAEVLPDHVLGPALHQFLSAELVGVLQIQQAGHQAQCKTGTARGGHAGSGHLHQRPEQIVLSHSSTLAHLAGKVGRQRRLDLRPGSRPASTANGWRGSIISASGWRKKSASDICKTPSNQNLICKFSRGLAPSGIGANSVFMRVRSLLRGPSMYS